MPTIKELLVSLAISEAMASIAVVPLVGFILEFELHYLIVPQSLLFSSTLPPIPIQSYYPVIPLFNGAGCYKTSVWTDFR